MAALARGAYAEVIEHSIAADAVASRPRGTLGIAALAAAYAGDLDQARELNDRMLAAAVSPTILAFGHYVAGEIDSAGSRGQLAEDHYIRAIDLARTSGATFGVGVAGVGLLALRADTGRIDDALRGCQDVIDPPSVTRTPPQVTPAANRARALEMAQQAIEQHLTES